MPTQGLSHGAPLFRAENAGRKPGALKAALAGMIITIALAWTGCSSKPAAPPEPVVTVQTAVIEPKTIQGVVTTEAVLYAIDQAIIVPKISAPIRKFYVNRGIHVHAGELLAVLENKDLSAALIQNQGSYDQAQATYATSTRVNLPAQIQVAQLNAVAARQAMQANQLVYQSRLKLYRSGAIARNLMNQSRVTYIQARNQYQIAAATLKALQAVGKSQMLKAAKGQLTSAKGSYLAAEAQFKYSEIRSPIDGVVTSRPLYPGEMASAGTPLMTVMNISSVVARTHVSPQQASRLRVGDLASISPGGGLPAITGKVTVISPALDPNSTTVQVWVQAPDPGGQLKVGSTVEVRMVAQTVKNALVAPAVAVLTAPNGTASVMVAGADGRAHQTSVKTGIHEGDEVQITSGLQQGERIVTEGAYGLPDGTKVKF